MAGFFLFYFFFCLIFCCCWLYQCHKEKTVNFITLDCTKCDLCQLHEGWVLLWGNTPYRTQGKLHVRANGPKILVNCPIWSWKLITNSHPGPQNESLTMRGAWFNALMIVGWKKNSFNGIWYVQRFYMSVIYTVYYSYIIQPRLKFNRKTITHQNV